MLSASPDIQTISEPELTLAVMWHKVKRYLEDKKRQIGEEINQYPPPIPACDVQFNYLLEQRAGISQELHRLNETFTETLKHSDSRKLLTGFIQSSSFIDDETKQGMITAVQLPTPHI